MDVEGYCDPRFASVAEEFERNFIERGDLGASVVVTLQGETVVDLWGGVGNSGSRHALEEGHVVRHDVLLEGTHRPVRAPPRLRW